MKKHWGKILFVVLFLGAGIICTEIEIAHKREALWPESFPMANQHIEWTYAGKGGTK